MGELESIALLLFGGLSFRFALTLTGQNWAKTYQQTVAFFGLTFYYLRNYKNDKWKYCSFSRDDWCYVYSEI